jgi:hypothetical protein
MEKLGPGFVFILNKLLKMYFTMIFLYFSVRKIVQKYCGFIWLAEFCICNYSVMLNECRKKWPEKSKVRTNDDSEKYIHKAQTILNPLV